MAAKYAAGKAPRRLITVVVFSVALLTQGYLSFSVSPEPYPSIRMPGFSLAAAKDRTFGVTLAKAQVVEKDGTLREISPTEIMSDFRFSTARPSYDYLFEATDPLKVPEDVKAWLRDRISNIQGGQNPAAIRMCWQEARLSVIDASIVNESPCTWKEVRL